MSDYKATIERASKEFTKRESIRIKDISNAEGIDKILAENDDFIIAPVDFAIISVDNPRAKGENKQYKKLVLIDEAGNKFVCGSESFIRAFLDIWEEMDGEPFEIVCFSRPSKNFSGNFITCSIV